MELLVTIIEAIVGVGLFLLMPRLFITTKKKARSPEWMSVLQHNDAQQLQAAIKAGLDVTKQTGGNPSITALAFAAKFASPEVLQTLLDAGLDVHETDPQGATLLHHAAAGNNAKAISFLLEKGIPIESKSRGLTPLMPTENYVGTAAAKALIAAGADVHAIYEPGDMSVLMVAVSVAEPEYIQLLIDNGANINEVRGENSNLTPLLLAISNRTPKIIQLLLDNGANPTPPPALRPDAFAVLANKNPHLKGTRMLTYLQELSADTANQNRRGSRRSRVHQRAR